MTGVQTREMHVPAGRRLALVVVLLGVLAAIALGAPSTASAAVSWAPAAERAVSSQQNCDPCTFIWVVRTGGGTVTSNIGSSVGNTGPTINCGSTCYGDFYSWELSRVVLTADGLFRGWEDCPEPNGNRCSIEFDGVNHCVKAYFQTGTEVAGACPPATLPPPPIGTGPQTPPPPSGGGLPSGGVRCSVVGTARADVLTGTNFDDKICGGGGNDIINGLGGDDYLNGGGGNDRIAGSAGRDRLLGGAGNDRLSGGASNDVLQGQGGRDTLLGDAGNDTLDGGSGVDTISGGAGNDSLVSRDRLTETVNGGAGRDRARADKTDRLRSVERRF